MWGAGTPGSKNSDGTAECLACRGVCNEDAVLQEAHSIVPVLGGSNGLLIQLVWEHDLGVISEILH